MSQKGKTAMFVLGVLGVAAIHFAASFFVAFAAGVSPEPSWKIASSILTFPLEFLPKQLELPGSWNWLVWAFVSLSWGFIICYSIRWLANAR